MLLDNFTKSSRSSRNVLSAALIIIATIAMYNWIVTPHSSYLFAAREYKSVVEKLVEQNEVVSTAIKTKEEKLQLLRKEIEQLEGLFFSPDKANEFFGDLQAIAEREGCVVNSLNLVKDKRYPERPLPRLGTPKQSSGKKQSELPADITAEAVMLKVVGEYGSIIEFLKQLRGYPQKVWLDSIKLEILNDGALRCEMKITIYTIKSFLSTDNAFSRTSKNPKPTIKRHLESEGRKAADND